MALGFFALVISQSISRYAHLSGGSDGSLAKRHRDAQLEGLFSGALLKYLYLEYTKRIHIKNLETIKSRQPYKKWTKYLN